jgi:hypothetical protein
VYLLPLSDGSAATQRARPAVGCGRGVKRVPEPIVVAEDVEVRILLCEAAILGI